jgi:putative transposase
MAARDDEATTRGNGRGDRAVRYQLVRKVADPQLLTKARGRLVRTIAAREHTDPGGRRVRVSRDTLNRWIRAWRAGGFDALVPSPRQPAPRLPAEVIEMAVALKRENRRGPPHRSSGCCGPRWAGPRASGPCNVTSPTWA